MSAFGGIEPDPSQQSLSRRHLAILDRLRRESFASVEDLAVHLGVSHATVRRGLTDLQKAGKIRRTHGGARLTDAPGWTLPNAVRTNIHRKEKEAIGRHIAGMIDANERVLIDAGTTPLEVARLLARRQDLSFVTVGLAAASVFANAQSARFIMIGGDFRPHNQSFSGPMAREGLERFRVDTAVLSTSGVDLERGVLTMGELDVASLQQMMFRIARRVIVAADHTKFTSSALTVVAPLQEVDTIVTGAEVDPEIVERLTTFGVRVERAS